MRTPDAGCRSAHRKTSIEGVLVDTNLLVLLLIGLVSKRRILEFKRTQDFTIEDFDLLARLIAWFGNLIATPHVLSQVSDLVDLPGKDLIKVRTVFRSVVELIDESYDSSRALVADPIFERLGRLGLADAAIATVCYRGILVLTTDVRLQLELQRRGADALSFNQCSTAWVD